jgi:hypothetical protein
MLARHRRLHWPAGDVVREEIQHRRHKEAALLVRMAKSATHFLIPDGRGERAIRHTRRDHRLYPHIRRQRAPAWARPECRRAHQSCDAARPHTCPASRTSSSMRRGSHARFPPSGSGGALAFQLDHFFTVPGARGIPSPHAISQQTTRSRRPSASVHRRPLQTSAVNRSGGTPAASLGMTDSYFDFRLTISRHPHV